MPKPFGKVGRPGLGLTKGMRLVIAVWAAAIPAWLICRIPARSRPTLADSPFYWTAALLLGLFYAIMIALWLRRRPSPRGPWESSRSKIFAVRFLLALLLAAPAGFATAWFYEPALTVANGMVPVGGRSTEHALVVRDGNGFALDSPYWEPPFRFRIPPTDAVPGDLAPGSLARLTLQRGILLARFVRNIEYEVLR